MELLDDPGEPADRGVVERLGQGLWAGHLDCQVAGAVFAEGVELLGASSVGGSKLSSSRDARQPSSCGITGLEIAFKLPRSTRTTLVDLGVLVVTGIVVR